MRALNDRNTIIPRILKGICRAAKTCRKRTWRSGILIEADRKGIAKLVENHEAGQKIQRKLWPRYYVQKYGINNLWRLRLDDYWRMIYTLIGEQVRIVAVILEVLDHKEYDKRFGYK